MIVICTCGATLKISDEKITVAGVKIKCPKCGNPHLVKKPAPEVLAPPADGLAMPWFASSMPSAAKPLVLIAHDSKVVADMIEQVVSEAGYSTVHAPDGLEALKKATDLKPQVMIVDVGLTGIYGFELCERLKGNPETRDIKIILLSSVYGLTAYKRSPVTLYGADDYIEKHHIPDKLALKIKRLLSGEAAETQQPAPAPEPGPAVPDRTEPDQAGRRSSPLIRNKGMLVQDSPTAGTMGAPEATAVPVTLSNVRKPALSEFADIMPKVPVTLDEGMQRTTAPRSPETAVQPPRTEKVRPEEGPAPTAVKTGPATTGSLPKKAAVQDESVMLDSSFFEQEEYDAQARTVVASPADPVEIEKARRFARLIVSDIALYNQEAVIEGLMNGTFYDLLRMDVDLSLIHI